MAAASPPRPPPPTPEDLELLIREFLWLCPRATRDRPNGNQSASLLCASSRNIHVAAAASPRPASGYWSGPAQATTGKTS
mmetsp:Transcript_25789/g.77459  ORF Transcript_25789/g.77459 Transcript_25789/m.77459 type:complete len:80 (+) Transcript_25789:1-240(+)